jgi:hypothetical protein
MYKYWGFGLNITSEIKFPELLPTDFTVADMTIAVGKTPEKLESETAIKRAYSWLTDDEYLLHLKTVGRYYAAHGNKIVVEPVPGIDEHSVRLFLLGTVIAAILYQRGQIPLHASAIVKDGRLVLFAGNSGAGKSTLIASLAKRGYVIFTDDICVLQHSSGNTEVLGTASYPMVKLWEDAIGQLDNEQFNKDFKIRPKLPKYGQFFYDKFNSKSLPVDKLFILSPQNNAGDISISKLPAMEAFREIEKQAYKNQLISNTKLRGLHFSLLSQISGSLPVLKVTRPLTGTNVELLSDAIEKLF